MAKTRSGCCFPRVNIDFLTCSWTSESLSLAASSRARVTSRGKRKKTIKQKNRKQNRDISEDED